MGQSCLSSGYAPAGATVANSTFPSCWQIPHATIAGKRQAMLCVNTWAHAKKKQVVAKGLCHTTAVPWKLTSPLSCMQAWPTLLTDSQECKRGAVEPWKQRKLLRNIPPKEQYAELTARHSFPFPKEQWDLCFFVQASLQHPRLAAEVIHMHVIHNSSPGFMVPFSLKNNTASRISKQGCWWWWLLRTLPRHPPAIDSYCTNTLPQNFR